MAQKNAENQALRQQTSALGQNVLTAEEQSVESKTLQADELYKKAVESGDAELMSKADTLKSDLSIQKEKLRIAKNLLSKNKFLQKYAKNYWMQKVKSLRLRESQYYQFIAHLRN